MIDLDDEPATTKTPLPIYFRLLYNWTQGLDQDSLLQHKVSMYPTFQVELYNTPIYRLIDNTLITINLQQRPQHWISAGQLWKACGLTLTEGFFLFQLAPSHYQLDFLIPSFPYQDIWVPLTLARSMATTLGVMDELAWFLDETVLGQVKSADHADRLEMVHNWQIIGIPNTSYSTRALLDYPLVAGEPLDILGNNDLFQPKTTTLMTRHQYQPGIVMKDRAESGLVRWQAWAYEQFLTTHQDPSLLSEDGGRTSKRSSVSSGRRRRQQQKQKIHWEGDGEPSYLDGDFTTTDGADDPVPATALWDVVQGLLCDLQSLDRRQQKDGINDEQQQQQQLKASRVFSDSMVIGNMPLKSAFLRQSTALQHIYLSVMMEKLYNAMEQLDATTIKLKKQHGMNMLLEPTLPPQPTGQQQERHSHHHHHHHRAATPTTTTGSSTTQSEKKTSSKTNSARQPQSRSLPQSTASQLDPNMMLHDRMDLLEQEMYRVKKKAKRKLDESELKWMELQHQLMTLDTWKRNLETRRKNERAWMLLIILLLSFVLWIYM
ncbi:hypothetical protein BC941DRAFT_425902 [Chlamydoabsidia padenii]|nr:hypothetical protein BC941DRAFT_425902 [Chlamydoabsidia padenii]